MATAAVMYGGGGVGRRACWLAESANGVGFTQRRSRGKCLAPRCHHSPWPMGARIGTPHSPRAHRGPGSRRGIVLDWSVSPKLPRHRISDSPELHTYSSSYDINGWALQVAVAVSLSDSRLCLDARHINEKRAGRGINELGSRGGIEAKDSLALNGLYQSSERHSLEIVSRHDAMTCARPTIRFCRPAVPVEPCRARCPRVAKRQGTYAGNTTRWGRAGWLGFAVGWPKLLVLFRAP